MPASLEQNSDEDSLSEPEEIFFAADFRSSLQSKSNGNVKNAKSKNPHLKQKAVQHQKISQTRGTPESSEDEGKEPHVQTKALPQSFEEVQAKMKGMQVEHQRMVDEEDDGLDKDKTAKRSLRKLSKAAKWKKPQQHGVVLPRARAGHVAALAIPRSDEEDPVVLLHGGIDIGGALLDDSYSLSISEDSEGMLDAIWTPASGGYLASGAAGQVKKPSARAFHTGTVWLNDDVDGKPCTHNVVVFGGASLNADGDPGVLDDLWILERSGSDDSGGIWKQLKPSGASPCSRWGHCASLVGGLKGAGCMMLVCGGASLRGNELSDCWILDLVAMQWEALEGPAISMGLGCATWLDAWGGVVFWGRSIMGMWRETESTYNRRMAKLKELKHAAAVIAKQNKRQEKLAQQKALAEDKRRLDAERADREAADKAARENAARLDAEAKRAELNEWRQRQEEQRQREMQAKKEAEAQQQHEREIMKEARRGGGFDVDKAAALRMAGPGTSSQASVQAKPSRMITVPVRPNFSGWVKQEGNAPHSECPAPDIKSTNQAYHQGSPPIPLPKNVEARSRSPGQISNSVQQRKGSLQPSFSNPNLCPGPKDNQQLQNVGKRIIGQR
eukprot:gnl/MRDRNA2_/MRDRNA2_194517_c0_seq1.p1 gnl/MRDRNA2_/MRDRNA2_194517_c0~~gnl/MRDRNA2_/MRDRNA2_194517_c0_seq1.p1  ORF type:complete len:674 (+),score=152.25 gnl/MRDRNA2_/MRDRNA2_194517_c0_seq1:182-2023(+)